MICVRNAARLAFFMPALIGAGALQGCTSAPDMTLEKFGLVGTFSDDCSKPIEAGGARAIYEVPESGYPAFTAVNKLGTFRSKIERVDQVSDDTLVMYVIHPDGAWDEIGIRKEGTGFRTIRMVVHKRNEWHPSLTIDSGHPVGNSVDALVAQKCSD